MKRHLRQIHGVDQRDLENPDKDANSDKDDFKDEEYGQVGHVEHFARLDQDDHVAHEGGEQQNLGESCPNFTVERSEPVRESTGTATFERLVQHLFHNEGRLEVNQQIADMLIDFDYTVAPANNSMDDTQQAALLPVGELDAPTNNGMDDQQAALLPVGELEAPANNGMDGMDYQQLLAYYGTCLSNKEKWGREAKRVKKEMKEALKDE
jgi:hypothetical protein